jgi:hypothetical protein
MQEEFKHSVAGPGSGLEGAMDDPISDPQSLPSSQSSVPRPKAFRISCSHLAITYPQCDLDQEVIKERLFSKLDCIQHYVIAREQHQDGNYHIHVYLGLQKKCDIRNARFFDIEGFHPNVQACWSPKQWYNYVKKDGNYVEDFNFQCLQSKNYIRNKADHQAWVDDMMKMKLNKEYNKIPLGIHWVDLAIEGKKRHWLIIGPSSAGKTSWLEDTFENHSVYKAINDKRGYYFDTYDSERYIVFDDWLPGRDLILNVSNVYKTKTPVHGGCRNHHRFWPIKQERIMIILTNIYPTYACDPAFETRFNVLDLYDPNDPNKPKKPEKISDNTDSANTNFRSYFDFLSGN